MSKSTAIEPPRTIVFDLGGVMAEISHSWEGASTVSGVPCSKLAGGKTKLTAMPEFDEYQAGSITLDAYLDRLTEFVGCERAEALRLHNGILVVEYPGVKDLVAEVVAHGCRTGCLSNTNEPHWEVLALNGQYPTIHSLEMKMASHLVGLNKPSPAIYERYCREFGLVPSDIAFFDDGASNVEGALACGWHARRIDPSQDTPAQMRSYLSELGVI